MKLLKKRGYTGTVRKIVTNDKTEVLGTVGTFKDLMEIGVVESVTNISLDTWLCVPYPDRCFDGQNGMGATREEAIQNTLFVKKLWEGKL